MSDVLEAAKNMQRRAAEGTSISIRLSLLEDLITEIQRLQTMVPASQHNPQMREKPADVGAIVMKHTGINHP